MKVAVSRKKKAHKAMCRNSTKENKWRYKGMKNKAMKAVSKAIRVKAEEALSELRNGPNGFFILAKPFKTDSKEVERGK